MNSLDDLALEYSSWRKTKKRRSEKIPDDLLIKTRQAVKDFGISAVQRLTKVTPMQLKRQLVHSHSKIQTPTKSKQSPLAVTLVELPLPDTLPIELVLPGGLIVRSRDAEVCLQLIKGLGLYSREERL